MSKTEDLLAQARLEVRRASPGWRQDSAAKNGPVSDASPSSFDAAYFHPDDSMDTSASLSEATNVHDSGQIGLGGRLKLFKRVLLRVLRFYTDRQSRFNSSVIQVLNGYAQLLSRLAHAGETLKQETISRVGAIEADTRELQDEQRGARDESSRVLGEVTKLGDKLEREAQSLRRIEDELGRMRDSGLGRDRALQELRAQLDQNAALAATVSQQAEATRSLAAKLDALRGLTERESHDARKQFARSAREIAEARAAGRRQEDTLRQLSTSATLSASLAEGHEEALDVLRAEIERHLREERERTARSDRALEEFGAQQQNQEETLGQLGLSARLAADLGERHEKALGEILPRLAGVGALAERQDRAFDDVASAATLASAAADRHEQELGSLREGVATLRETSAAQDRALDDLGRTASDRAVASVQQQAELGRVGERIAGLEATGESHREAIERASGTATGAIETTQRLEALLGKLRDGAEGLRTVSDAQQQTLHALWKRSGSNAETVERHGADLGELRDALVNLRSEAATRAETIEKLVGMSEGATNAAEHQSERIEQLTSLTDGLQEQVGSRYEELQRGVGEVKQSLGAAESRIETTSGQLSRLSERGHGLQSDRMARLYAQFEERFRGTAEEIHEKVLVYVDRIAEVSRLHPDAAFLDLGCGRGELVAALRRAGVAAEGVEANPIFADACKSAGLPVHHVDFFEELRSRPDASLAGLSAIQVVEHLQPEALLELLELARAKIAKSGILILETIDLRTLYALRWFYADPTHVLPLIPETLSFYVENAGFADLEVLPLHPVPEDVAPTGGGGKRMDRVREVVFGPQDFAVIARRPPVQKVLRLPTPARPPRANPKPRPAEKPSATEAKRARRRASGEGESRKKR